MKKTLRILGWVLSAVVMAGMACVGSFSGSPVIVVLMAIGIGGYMTGFALSKCPLPWLSYIVMGIVFIPMTVILLICMAGGPAMLAASGCTLMALFLRTVFAVIQKPLEMAPAVHVPKFLKRNKDVAPKVKVGIKARFVGYWYRIKAFFKGLASKPGKWINAVTAKVTGLIKPRSKCPVAAAPVQATPAEKHDQLKAVKAKARKQEMNNFSDIPGLQTNG